jgi:hypothetical protein
MIGHFPSLYPEETVQSGIARFAGRVDFPSDKTVAHSLFQRKTITAVTDLPARLSTLISRLPGEMAVAPEILIDQHTLWPFLAAFQAPEKRKEIRNQMIQVGHPYLCLGLMAARCPFPAWLRYCSSCAFQDRQTFEEAYWHWLHQAPGIAVCAQHHVRLQDSGVSCRHGRNRHEFAEAESAIPREFESFERGTNLEVALAQEAEWILQNPQTGLPFYDLRTHFLRRLTEMGLATHTGRIRRSKLLAEFSIAYADDFLTSTGCALRTTKESWIERLLMQRRSCQHPLRYLLFAHFTGLRICETIKLGCTSPQPFGQGPWPCLNKAADHHGAPTIDNCQITATKNGRSLAGYFSCLQCDMVYVRIGPDRALSERTRRHRIPQYGGVWDNRLRQVWDDPNTSLRQLCRMLGVDPRTAQKQAYRLGLPLGRPRNRGGGGTLQRAHIPSGPKRDVADVQSEWISLCCHMPMATISQLRKSRPDLYTFLQRHAHRWLKCHAPTRSQPRHRRYLDWNTRDAVIAAKVDEAAARLRTWDPPVWLTRTALLREAGFLWVSRQKLKLLPHTVVALENLTETRIDFAVRRNSGRCPESGQNWRVPR